MAKSGNKIIKFPKKLQSQTIEALVELWELRWTPGTKNELTGRKILPKKDGRRLRYGNMKL